MILPSVLLIAVIYFRSITLVMCEYCIPNSLHKRSSDCCRMPEPFPVANLYACDRKARQSHSARTYVISLCKMECYFNELGIINDDTLVRDQVKHYLENVEDPAREFYETAFETCDDEFKENNTKFVEAMCSSYAASLNKCVQMKKTQQCPTKYFIDSDLCNKVKQGYKFCHE